MHVRTACVSLGSSAVALLIAYATAYPTAQGEWYLNLILYLTVIAGSGFFVTGIIIIIQEIRCRKNPIRIEIHDSESRQFVGKDDRMEYEIAYTIHVAKPPIHVARVCLVLPKTSLKSPDDNFDVIEKSQSCVASFISKEKLDVGSADKIYHLSVFAMGKERKSNDFGFDKRGAFIHVPIVNISVKAEPPNMEIKKTDN